MVLLEWCRKEKLLQPVYQTVQRSLDKFFHSVVTVNEKKYCSVLRDKSKKLAEQAAAIVCLRTLGLPEGKIGEGESDLVYKRKREFHYQNVGSENLSEMPLTKKLHHDDDKREDKD
ncbi:PREDICTED: tRNA-dihydrouridine(20) synthase [NAD(P)+]-like [Nanorana parkeri]|uniref:tRNA-dihydrouridine(20) synthase [NAD(P)+]-like n=1 Tax=Nanorana parkeri TaxID=125878 RepID=UPI000854E96C|nr:PREDICTED: tRNA-dihydrouridine(20) synthase [NAD(P)+]-like [Nanorana parkeri]